MQHQSFVPLQREPALHEYKEDVISVTSPGEDMLVQSEIDSKQHVASPSPFVQKNEQVSSGHQHPFGLLLKEHTQKDSGEPVEGISFPTIEDVRIFIESMKSSFLIPGSDPSKHFQTAQQTLENEMGSGAQNTKGESSDPVEGGSAHDDSSENEVWNSAFEQSKQGGNYETPSESLPVSDAVISTTGLISPRAYESQDSGLGSYIYPSPQFAATEHVSSNYGHFSNAVLGETPDFLTYPPDEQNEDVQSTSYMLPEQIPFSSNSLYSEDFSFRAHVTDSPLNPPDLRYYSRKTSSITPLISEQTSQQPKYTSHSEDPPTGYQKPSDFDMHEYFQRENLGKVTPEKPQSSYGKSFYISVPRVQYPDLQPTHGERPAPLLQRYPLTAGNEINDINFSPSVHLPVSSVSVSSSSDTLSQLRSSGQVGVQASSPLDPQNQVFSRKQPVKSHLMFTAKPSSSLRGSSRHNDHLGDQSVSVHHPSVFNSQAKYEEKSDLSKHALFSAIQKPKHMIENIQSPFSNGLDVSFNSLANLAPTSKSKKASSRLVDEVMSRHFETQNMISDMFPTGVYSARNPSDLFSTSLRPGISLNDGYLRATRADLLQTFIQPPKEQKRPANMNKKTGKVAKRPFKPMSTANVFGSTLNSILWGNDGYRKRPPRQAGPNVLPPSVNAYIVKSRNGYVRRKVSLSKTRYTPHLMTEGQAGNDQKNPA
ncbi:uncharacterized protein LOC122986240 [Scomber scombrus]